MTCEIKLRHAKNILKIQENIFFSNTFLKPTMMKLKRTIVPLQKKISPETCQVLFAQPCQLLEMLIHHKDLLTTEFLHLQFVKSVSFLCMTLTDPH